MLRVTVDLIPQGQHALTETLDTIYVANDGTGSGLIGHYDVYTSDPTEHPIDRDEPGEALAAARQRRPGWIGRIENVERTEKHRALLSAQALELAVATGQI